MSRTKHHKGQKNRRCGLDYGSKYKHNKGYCGGYGPDAKNAADSERRQQGKKIVRNEVDYTKMEDW